MLSPQPLFHWEPTLCTTSEKCLPVTICKYEIFIININHSQLWHKKLSNQNCLLQNKTTQDTNFSQPKCHFYNSEEVFVCWQNLPNCLWKSRHINWKTRMGIAFSEKIWISFFFIQSHLWPSAIIFSINVWALRLSWHERGNIAIF